MSKPGRRCATCDHKDRPLIEVGLVSGVPLRTLAERHGLTHWSIGRHARRHLSAAQRAAVLRAMRPEEVDLDAMRGEESQGVLGHIVGQRARLIQMSQAALLGGDVRTMVMVEGAIGQNIALSAKLLGQLKNVHEHVHTSLLVSPDYLEMRRMLMARLRQSSDPDIARLVAADFATLEARSAPVAPPRPAPRTIEHEPAAPVPLPPPPALAPLAPFAYAVMGPPPPRPPE